MSLPELLFDPLAIGDIDVYTQDPANPVPLPNRSKPVMEETTLAVGRELHIAFDDVTRQRPSVVVQPNRKNRPVHA